MNVQPTTTFLLLPQAEWETLKKTQTQILEALRNLQDARTRTDTPVPGYLTALEFMRAVKICRSKFDQLAGANKITVIKKKRKVYVPFREVERYFSDPAIQ